MGELRWRLADDDGGQGSLFDADSLLDRHVGTGEFAGTEFLHVNAKRIINRVPEASRLPFRYTINAYRGCSHACVYCAEGSTPVLMLNGSVRALAALRRGDRVYGTRREGASRRLVPSEVLDHWEVERRAYEVLLSDGTRLVVSEDHQLLSDRGWKHVTGTQHGTGQRPHLTTNNRLLGVGQLAIPPSDSRSYRTGYLTGMIRGDGSIGRYSYPRGAGANDVHRFRLALCDREALMRTKSYLASFDVAIRDFLPLPVRPGCTPTTMFRCSRRRDVERIEELVRWPGDASIEWHKGFLAGIFDAEGSYSRGILRVSNKDESLLAHTVNGLSSLGFDGVLEPMRPGGVRSVRVRGGLVEHLAFFIATDPAITRKRDLSGTAIKFQADLRVLSVKDLGEVIPMYDITTSSGDYISNGVISHNCFARPTHEYLGLDAGRDFETKIVVKINAVERVRAELASKRWAGEAIAMGTNTDPYQRCEGKYRLTRGIIGALVESRNPFSILTKSTLVLRDLDLLREAADLGLVRLSFSIGTLDEAVWKETEPGTPHPRQRVAALRRMTGAGIPCDVLVAPVIPGLSDRPEQVAAVVRACREAGAGSAAPITLHLRPGVKEHYMEWLAGAHPELVSGYEDWYRGRSYLKTGRGRGMGARR